MNQRGMTLIELMISIAILGTLTIMTTQSIIQGIKSKEKVQTNLDKFSLIRDTLNIIRQDIEKAFHHKDLNIVLRSRIEKSSPDSGSSAKSPEPPPSTTPPPIDNAATHFIGQENYLHFVTLNHKRIYSDTPEANYLEVGYYLDSCRNQKGDKTSQCLWRRTNPLVDEDVEKGGRPIVLLENVTEFELRYFGQGKQDWASDWRSDERGDAATKNHFPEAVEISLTIKESDDDKAKKHSFQITVPIRFPNNEKEDTGNDSGSTSAPPTK